jgi:hypothetical protein
VAAAVVVAARSKAVVVAARSRAIDACSVQGRRAAQGH